MSRRALQLLITLAIAGGSFQTAPAFGASSQVPGQQSGGSIDVTADSLSVTDKGLKVQGKGNAEVKREGMTLKADQVSVNRETQDMEASGNVSIDDPEWKVKRADRVQFNLGKETGEIEKGDLFIESGHLSASGARFKKLGGQAYHIDEGFFTTCLCESGPPSWKISADEIDIKQEGSGVIKRGWFYIMDVPILYIPYAIFPLNTERQSGFLFPKFGYSGRDGFQFQLPYFWAISKSTDATFTADIETRTRLGFIGEFRTVLSKDTQIQFQGSYFNESMRSNADERIKDDAIADPNIPIQRWSAVGSHRQGTNLGWQTYSDIAAFSDDLFTRELTRRFSLAFEDEKDLRSSRYSRSRMGFYRNWGDVQFEGQADYYQDFIQEDRHTFQRAPQLLAKGNHTLGETPLLLNWRAEGVSFVRRNGPAGMRVDLRPEVALPFNLGSYLYGALSVAPRATVYNLYENKDTVVTLANNPGDSSAPFRVKHTRTLAQNPARGLVEVTGRVGTSFGRVFDFGESSSVQKLKHTIEPEVSYLFIPQTGQHDIPIMDGTDRINGRSVVTFALTNRLWGKFGQPVKSQDRDVEDVTTLGAGDIRELGKLRLALSYDAFNQKNGGKALSDLDMNLRVTPVDYLALGFDAGIDPSDGRVSQAAALFSIYDPRPITRRVLDRDFMRPNSFDLAYRFVNKTRFHYLAEDANIDLEGLRLGFTPTAAYCGTHTEDPRCAGRFGTNVLGQISANLLYHATDHILFLLNSAYNIRDTHFAGVRAAVKLLSKCECWTVAFTLTQEINPSNTGFHVDFSLLGLGSQNKGQAK
jgi:LPS-assembly protein